MMHAWESGRGHAGRVGQAVERRCKGSSRCAVRSCGGRTSCRSRLGCPGMYRIGIAVPAVSSRAHGTPRTCRDRRARRAPGAVRSARRATRPRAASGLSRARAGSPAALSAQLMRWKACAAHHQPTGQSTERKKKPGLSAILSAALQQAFEPKRPGEAAGAPTPPAAEVLSSATRCAVTGGGRWAPRREQDMLSCGRRRGVRGPEGQPLARWRRCSGGLTAPTAYEYAASGPRVGGGEQQQLGCIAEKSGAS
jgi:hypothetical protein